MATQTEEQAEIDYQEERKKYELKHNLLVMGYIRISIHKLFGDYQN